MTFKRDLLVKLPVLGMLALAAACGGDKGGNGDTGAATGDQSAAGTSAAPAAPAAPAADAGTAATPAPAGNVVEVKAVTTQNGASGEFQPKEITVKKGDTVRWTADGAVAHDVSFSNAPENAGKPNLPQDSPYLTTAGQTWELNTANLEPGTYHYVCIPHQAMGMVGTLVVH